MNILPQPFFDLELMLLRKLEETRDLNDVDDDLVAVRRVAALYKELKGMGKLCTDDTHHPSCFKHRNRSDEL